MNKTPNHSKVRTWIEIDKSALLHNYHVIRQLLKKECRMMAVVKSNAYGHGLFDLALRLEQIGIDWFGVDSITEARTLRRKGIEKPILVLGYTLPNNFEDAAKYKISLTVSSLDHIATLGHAKLSHVKIHLKIDTGMHRQGFLPVQMKEVIKLFKTELPNQKLEGVFTHLADSGNEVYSRKQIGQFKKVIYILNRAGYFPICHVLATDGILNLPEAHFDMVRPGRGLLGLTEMSQATRKQHDSAVELIPVLSWRTIVSEVKGLPQGSMIGYGLCETLAKDSKVAICPIGYWHGYPRSLSGVGEVLVKGKRCKVVGRVSMDMIVIDVSLVSNPKVGDVVTLLGSDGKENLNITELARKANVYPLEFLTRLNPLMKRIYL